MKSAKLIEKRKIKTVDIPEPDFGEDYVTCKVLKAGICGSDIHYWDMGLPTGLVMGHEFCGMVENPGNRKDLKVGDRITALPISPCGNCPACKSGNPQYCPATWDKALGLSLTNPGAYAEKTAIRSDLVIKVPKKISDEEVAMVEPTAVALHAVNLANIQIGDSVLVIGGGIIGDLCAMFAKLNGASYVAMSETNEKRGKKSVKLHATDEWFQAKDLDFMTKVLKHNPYGYDKVIDCSGNSPAVSTAIMCARPNGTLVLVGVSMENISIPSILLVMHELIVKGAIGYTKEEFELCIDLIKKKKIDVLKFMDDIVSINNVQKAFERLTSGKDDAIKILIDPNKTK